MKERYYKCIVYVRVVDDGWDASCDELAALGRAVNNDEGFFDFEEVTKKEFKESCHKLFDKFGGM